MSRILFGILVLSICAGSASAQTAAELGRELLTRLHEEQAAGQGSQQAGDVARLAQAAQIVRECIIAEDASLRALSRATPPKEAVLLLQGRPALQNLAERWEAQREKEIDDRRIAASNEVEAAARELIAKVREATDAAELNAPMSKLSTLAAKHPGPADPQFGRGQLVAAGNARLVLDFARLWQTMLVSESAGEKLGAAAALTRLAGTKSVPTLANSELISMVNGAARRLGILSLDEAEDSVRAIIEKAMSAKTAAELDEPLERLIRARSVWERWTPEDPADRSPRRTYEAGAEFLARWQEVIVKRASGDFRGAGYIAKSLAQTAQREPLYPRGKLLEIQQALEHPPADAAAKPNSAADTILARMKTPGDIAANFAAFKASTANDDEHRFHTVVNDLARIQAGAIAFENGDLNEAWTATQGGFDKHPKVPELRAQLKASVISAVLRTDGESTLRPGEGGGEFAVRLAREARDRKDWSRVRELLEAPLSRYNLASSFAPGDLPAIRSFFAARNLEAAGVWHEAVASYVAALKTGSEFVPSTEIAKSLDAIRRGHPDDFARGTSAAKSADSKRR